MRTALKFLDVSLIEIILVKVVAEVEEWLFNSRLKFRLLCYNGFS